MTSVTAHWPLSPNDLAAEAHKPVLLNRYWLGCWYRTLHTHTPALALQAGREIEMVVSDFAGTK